MKRLKEGRKKRKMPLDEMLLASLKMSEHVRAERHVSIALYTQYDLQDNKVSAEKVGATFGDE